MKLKHAGITYDVLPDGRVFHLPSHAPPEVRIPVDDPELREAVWQEHQRQMVERRRRYFGYLGRVGCG